MKRLLHNLLLPLALLVASASCDTEANPTSGADVPDNPTRGDAPNVFPRGGDDGPTTSDEGVSLETTADGGWRLVRNGEPYDIYGVGGFENLEQLQEAGGNSIRTWGADQTTLALLDEAHALGLTVCVGLWMGHVQDGFDYTDEAAVAAQLERHRQSVLALKDHPALLMWGVGNEMELNSDTPKMWRAVEQVAAMIKDIDPLHPTLTVTADLGEAHDQRLLEHCPSIDIWGINTYGGLPSLAERLDARGWTGPYVITEYGPEGTWAARTTAWGTPLEDPTEDKRATYAERHAKVQGDPRSLGGYAFVWLNALAPTDTWFPLFRHDGTPLAPIDALHEAWTGAPPDNLAPVVRGIASEAMASRVEPGEALTATLQATDPEEGALRTTWLLTRDSADIGAFWQPSETCRELALDADTLSIDFDAPTSPGAWRLIGVTEDEGQKAGMATMPFFVNGPEPDGLALPLYVGEVYAPSGWMGHTATMTLDTCEHPTAGVCGGRCDSISWTPGGEGWVGIAWQYPANNWGAQPGLAIDSAARTIAFVAWADRPGVEVSIFAGLDTSGFNVNESVALGPAPQTYTIDLPNTDFSSVVSAFGFTMGTPDDGQPVTIHFAGVRWE